MMCVYGVGMGRHADGNVHRKTGREIDTQREGSDIE